jgi:hypothetical protein
MKNAVSSDNLPRWSAERYQTASVKPIVLCFPDGSLGSAGLM